MHDDTFGVLQDLALRRLPFYRRATWQSWAVGSAKCRGRKESSKGFGASSSGACGANTEEAELRGDTEKVRRGMESFNTEA